jgi:hypothetical protein
MHNHMCMFTVMEGVGGVVVVAVMNIIRYMMILYSK